MASRLIGEAIFCNFSICRLVNQRQLNRFSCCNHRQNWFEWHVFILFRHFPLDRKELEEFPTSPTPTVEIDSRHVWKNVNLFAITNNHHDVAEYMSKEKSRAENHSVRRVFHFPFSPTQSASLDSLLLQLKLKFNCHSSVVHMKRSKPDRMIWK